MKTSRRLGLQVPRLDSLPVVLVGATLGSFEKIADLAIECVVEIGRDVHAFQFRFHSRFYDQVCHRCPLSSVSLQTTPYLAVLGYSRPLTRLASP